MYSMNARPVIAPVPHRADSVFDLWRSVTRHKALLTTVTGAFCAAGVAYILFATPQYRAEALLRVQQSNKTGSSISAFSDVSGSMAADASASDEADVLTSRTIVTTAIDETNADTTVVTGSHFPLIGRWLASRHASDDELAPAILGLTSYAWGGERLKAGVFNVPSSMYKKKFHVVADQGGQWTLYDDDDNRLAQGRIKELVKFKFGNADQEGTGEIRIDMLRARPGVSFDVTKYSQQTSLDDVLKRLRATIPPRDSSLHDVTLIRLSYQANSPFDAQSMVNTVIRTYQERDILRRSAQAQTSLDFLKKRLPVLKSDLETAEGRLNTFRTQTGTIDMAEQNTALITRMSRLQAQQTELQLALNAAQQRFRSDDSTYQTALVQLNQVKHEIAETTQLAENLPSTQRQYVELARDAAVATQLYTSVLTNAQQLEVAAASTPPGVAVVDWAIAPENKSWPRSWVVLAGSLFGGLFLSTVAIYLLELSRRELHRPEELDSFSHLPRLAVVARSTVQMRHDVRLLTQHAAPARLLAMTSPADPSIEALRSLRSSVLAMLNNVQISHPSRFGYGNQASPLFESVPMSTIDIMPSAGHRDLRAVTHPGSMVDVGAADAADGGKIILFTGPTQGVGKSFVSSNFAYLMAETHASVLLIDADMRRGRLRSLVSGRKGPGLAEVLEGSARFEDAIVSLGTSGFSLLDAGAYFPANPAELIGRPVFQEMLTTLRGIYDYIVIDSPPVLPVGDALSIAMQSCDLVLLVSRASRTGARQLEETVTRLSNVGAKVGGHVFNGFKPDRYDAREEYGLQTAY